MNKPLVNFHDYSPTDSDFLQDVLQGLSQQPKSIPPKYFYDERGSQLFDAICQQPEYYPTRTEIGILQDNAEDIAKHIDDQCMVVELGSGASEKVRLLFEELKPAGYLGVDISRDFLLQATQQLASDYHWLDVHAVCADFSEQLTLPDHCENAPLLAFYPGSSIGNFEPTEARRFLKQVAGMLGTGGKLLIGVDLKKDPDILNAAYNDEAGITADFNLNLLSRMRDELDASLDDNQFTHYAFYNHEKGRVEMHLVSQAEQHICIGEDCFELQNGETIHTENSYKYDLQSFTSMASFAGFRLEANWRDAHGYFGVLLLTKV